MAKNTFIFQDHDNSYLIWKRFKLKDMPLVHIDTHFDFGDEITKETLEKIKKAKKEKDLKKYRLKSKVPADGFHLGNFLYPALMDNTISKLIWVVPDFLVEGKKLLQWVYNEIINWFDPYVNDLKSLRYEKGQVKGSIFSKPLVITTLSALNEIKEDVLLDIDLDYFFNDKTDLIWIHPYKFIDIITQKVLSPYLITIAYSVNGGYTHPQNAYIGDILYHYFNNKNKLVKPSILNKIFLADKAFLKDNNYKKAINLYKEVLSSDFLFKDYIYYKLSLIYEKTKDESLKDYINLAKNISGKVNDLEKALLYFRKANINKAIKILEGIKDKDLFVNLTLAYMYMENKDYNEAKDLFLDILNKYIKKKDIYLKSRIYQDLAIAYYNLSNYEDALLNFNNALKINNTLANSYIYTGRIYKKLDKVDDAIFSFRAALRLLQDKFSSIEVIKELYILYSYKKDKNRADTMLRHLKELDFSGLYYLKAILQKNAYKKRSSK